MDRTNCERRSGAEEVIDGRRLRRERGRQRVVDAMLDLVLEDGVAPTVDQVTERARVSPASLFRYFGTLDELRHEAIGRYIERFDDLMVIPEIGDGSLGDRVERFVAARDAFYARTAPMARLARRQADAVAELAETLDRVRCTFAEQIGQHFAPELGGADRQEARQRVAVIAAVTSFEAWEQLASLGDAGRREALVRAVETLTHSGCDPTESD